MTLFQKLAKKIHKLDLHVLFKRQHFSLISYFKEIKFSGYTMMRHLVLFVTFIVSPNRPMLYCRANFVRYLEISHPKITRCQVHVLQGVGGTMTNYGLSTSQLKESIQNAWSLRMPGYGVSLTTLRTPYRSPSLIQALYTWSFHREKKN